MRLHLRRLALIGSLTVTLCVAAAGGQKEVKATRSTPASPQTKTPPPATHFTQGTIASIEATRIVISRKVHGKDAQETFTMDAQTQRSGNLTAGTRVSVQYRETNSQKTAAAVRELPANAADKSGKTDTPRPKG
jgi:hypothetical protein